MNGYFINITSSTFKIAFYNGDQPPIFILDEVLPTSASHSKIVDPKEFSKDILKKLSQSLGNVLPKLPLFFILEPEATELFLLTTKKDLEDEEDFLNKQIKDRLVGKNIDDYFYSYFKIAPFIYQFVGIKKDYVESILTTANILGLEIGGIIPWGLVLAKTNSNVSSMFVFPSEKESTVVFNEFTGVSFAEKLEGKTPLSELKELFWKLSVYNNKQGELYIYTFKKYENKFGSNKVTALGNGDLKEDYEEVCLARQVLINNFQLLNTQMNLINILPVPQTENKKVVPAVILAGMGGLILMAGLIVHFTVGFSGLIGNGPAKEVTQEVLSQQNQAPSPTPHAEEKPIEEPKKEIKRSDIKIRVENGNGVTGSAGKLKTYLEGFGYTVTEVGNADKSNYTKTTVVLPSELLEYKELLTNDLKTNYQVEVSNGKKQANYDVLIIAGQN